MKIALVLVIALATVSYAQIPTPPCAFLQISNAAQCDSTCSSNGASASSFSSGDCVCTIEGSSVPVCYNVSPTTYLIALLDQLAPQECQSLFRSVFNDDLLNCFFEPNALSALEGFGNFSEPFDPTICDNRCVGRAFGAANTFTMNTNGITCSSALAILSDDDSTPFNVTELEAVRAQANLVCAEGGMGYCGDLGQIITTFLEGNGNITAAECMTINNRGKCLGNVEAYFNMGVVRGVNGTQLVSMLGDACAAESVDISAASTGTEAPADVSSGSFVASAFFAIVATALIALLF